jgi:lipopolysaccharide export system permease protein
MMRTILASTALVLVVLLALAGLFEFIAELDDVRGDYQTPQAILYTALRLPNLAFEMLPVAALIGSLLGLGALAGNSEIIVMRSAGISVSRLAGMVAVSGFVLLVLTGLLGEFIGPPLDFYARDMRTEARIQKDADLSNEAWVKDGPVYLHLERVSSEFEFGTLYVFRFNEENELTSIAQAENSGIGQRGVAWQFFGETAQFVRARAALVYRLPETQRPRRVAIRIRDLVSHVEDIDCARHANPVTGLRFRFPA